MYLIGCTPLKVPEWSHSEPQDCHRCSVAKNSIRTSVGGNNTMRMKQTNWIPSPREPNVGLYIRQYAHVT